MVDNPLKQVYNGLWEMLLRNPNLIRYIKERNRIRFDTPPSPKRVISEGDLPELAWLPSGGPVNIRANSSATEFERMYTLAVTTGLDICLYDEILFEIIKALVDWDVVLCPLQWPEGRHFIVDAAMVELAEGLDTEETRGIHGWTAMMSLKVIMSFSTASLRIVSQEFFDD